MTVACHYSFDTENGGIARGEYTTKKGVRFTCGVDVKNRVITYAPLGCRKLRDVTAVIAKPDENVYELYYQKISSRAEHEVGHEEIVNHVWNLAWEWKPLMAWYMSKAKDGWELSYDSVVTVNNWYELRLMTPVGKMIFVDDNNHYHTKVATATKELMKKSRFKEIFDTADEGKALIGKESALVEKLHEIWYSYGKGSVEWDTYIHYARVDAFCQALLMESLFETGRFCTPKCFDGDEIWATNSCHTALSASGAGFRDAKSRLIYGCAYKDIPVKLKKRIESYAEKKGREFDEVCAKFMGEYLDRRWTERFGLLKEKDQLLVENNLRGGFVYAKTGRFFGRFWHYDYKSSYPYEYAYCKLPLADHYEEKREPVYKRAKGEDVPVLDENGKQVYRTVRTRRCVHKTSDPDEIEEWLRRYDDDTHQLYVIAQITFELKPGAMPLLTAKECLDDAGLAIVNYGGDRAKKMESGKTKMLVWTLEEWKLLQRLYIVKEAVLDSLYMCKAETGYFEDAVKAYFDGKESSAGAERAMHKLDLNGATHGRAMIRVMTAPVIELRDGKLFNATVKEGKHQTEKDIKTNPLVGMTAMAHARVRLLNHCMDLVEKGYTIYMCDTDSMVTDCPPDVATKIWSDAGWKNWVIHEKDVESMKEKYKAKKQLIPMKKILGKLEVETFGNKDHPEYIGVEEFDEFRCWGLKRYCELQHGVFRKSAFAGMHDEDQRRLLGGEYKKMFSWESQSKQWLGECYGLRYHDVMAGEEDIWYRA